MDWSYNEVLNLLDTFAAWNRCFTVQEVADWAAAPVNLGQLCHSFSQDARFVRLSQTGWESEYFLPEREMFKWWAGFNLRLATIGQDRLTERQLTAAMNALRPEGIWFTPPVDALEYGREFGFVADAWMPGFYVFPIAHILTQVPPHFQQVSRKAFADFESPQVRKAAMQQRTSEAVENLLSQFDPRTYRIVKSREALPPNQRSLTLAELGKQLGCTRERVRQIESRFWKRIKHPQTKERTFLIPALIARLMQRRGSLVLDSGQWEAANVRFLAKAGGVPSSNMPFGNIRVLGIAEFEPPATGYFGSPAERIDTDKVAEWLDAGSLSFLGRDDLGLLAAAIAQHNRDSLNKAERAYLTLRHIGKPAHFTEVAAIYNLLFPDEWSSEKNVHAVLTRRDIDQYGIVWIGAGVYALTEDGYERPGIGEFDPPMSTIAGRLYAALQHIGKQAHASEVTEVYNSMFPEDQRTPENIHAVLSRCAASDTEQYGIVWVGVKGTYALKEHGYERPKLGIFEAVAKIVEDKYAETGKSVHISVITTELGKHRQFVNPVSLAFATGVNDRIEQVSKDFFIPRAVSAEAQDAANTLDQDRVLREFWAERGGNV